MALHSPSETAHRPATGRNLALLSEPVQAARGRMGDTHAEVFARAAAAAGPS